MRTIPSPVRILPALALGLAALAATAEPTLAPADAEVYIINPADGATVSSPLTVRFGPKGMGVAPGRHSLQLLPGDYAHLPHDPPVISKRATITVE